MKKQLAALLLGLSALYAQANEAPPVYDRIAFTISAEQEVANDVLTAKLYAEQQGQDTAAMAQTINQTMQWAMQAASQENAVEARTLNYTTNPTYSNGKINGWQVRQEIELESKDSEKLSALLNTLQEQLRIQNINYSVSKEVSKSTEENLIKQALANFKQRAEQIKTGMGRNNYRVVRLDIQSANHNFPTPAYQMRNMEMAPAGALGAAPPTLESGKQELRVNIAAEIELSLD